MANKYFKSISEVRKERRIPGWAIVTGGALIASGVEYFTGSMGQFASDYSGSFETINHSYNLISAAVAAPIGAVVGGFFTGLRDLCELL